MLLVVLSFPNLANQESLCALPWIKSSIQVRFFVGIADPMLMLLAWLLTGLGSALDVNSSQCVSNRGLPYTKEDCSWIAKAYGCTWHGRCLCANNGTYSKTSHYCWPPEESAPTTTSTTTLPSSPGNSSVCRSNSGRPYDKDNCEWTAKLYGCIWSQGQCVCSNGGIYAKSSHYCWPPSDPTTTTSTSTLPTTSVPATNGSVCVSNKGHPYDQSNCDWVAKDFGCQWRDGRCVCSNGGTFSKSSKKCWPASSSPTTALPPGPDPKAPIGSIIAIVVAVAAIVVVGGGLTGH